MRGKSQVVVVVACLALTGCAAAMQYTVTADLFIQPSRVLQGDIFDIGGPSPAFTPPSGPSSEAPTMPGQPAEITAGRLLRLWVCRAGTTSRSSDHASREGDAAHRGTVLVMDDQVGVRASVRAISEEMCDLGEAEDG